MSSGTNIKWIKAAPSDEGKLLEVGAGGRIMASNRMLTEGTPVSAEPILYAGDITLAASGSQTINIPPVRRVLISVVSISGAATLFLGDAATHGIPIDAKSGYVGEYSREWVGSVKVTSAEGGVVRCVIEEVP